MTASGNVIDRVCYVVDTSGGEDYDPEAVAAGQIGHFHYVVKQRIATLKPQIPVPNESTVRELLDPLIAAWNVDALLALGPGAFHLQYIHAVNEGESQAGNCSHELPPANAGMTQFIHRSYPEAPRGMIADDDVLTLAGAYAQVLKEPGQLIVAGRTCVEILDRRFGSRKLAAGALHADLRALNRLAEITSAWGRRAGAEKITTWRGSRRVSNAERQWITEVLRALTRRLAQVAAGNRPEILLSRLP